MTPRSSESRSGSNENSLSPRARVDVLRQLRATPEIFMQIGEWQGSELAL
jgi:hypothetical protein